MATKDEWENYEKIKKIKTENGVEDFYHVLYDDVPEKFRKYAREKLNETDENKKKSIQKLRLFLEKENISCPNDEFIVTALRTCKYDIKKSKSKLKRFLKVRQFIAENLLKIGTKKIEIMLNDMFVCLLPYRDKDGRTIFTTRPEINLDLYEIDEAAFCVLVTLLFAVSSFPLTSICGFTYIAEVKTPHFYLLYPVCDAFRRYIRTLLDLPTRVRKIDLVNEIAVVRWTICLIKPFLGKIARRITLNGPSYKDILNYYHPDIIPNDLGGNLGLLSNEFYRKKLLDFIANLIAEFNNSELQSASNSHAF